MHSSIYSFHNCILIQVPEPIVEKVKCELPEYEGTIRERSKKVNKVHTAPSTQSYFIIDI